jgi:hypothetical protein
LSTAVSHICHYRVCDSCDIGRIQFDPVSGAVERIRRIFPLKRKYSHRGPSRYLIAASPEKKDARYVYREEVPGRPVKRISLIANRRYDLTILREMSAAIDRMRILYAARCSVRCIGRVECVRFSRRHLDPSQETRRIGLIRKMHKDASALKLYLEKVPAFIAPSDADAMTDGLRHWRSRN